MTIQNDYVYLRLDEKEVWAQDSTDVYNGTSMYSVSKRNIGKAIDAIHAMFNSETKYTDITEKLREFNIQYHTYCSVD